jgi:GNAT superfamily N-acetyltransferase
MNALAYAYEALKPRLPMSFDDFCKTFEPFEIIGVNGGAVMVRGNEVHVAVVKSCEGKWISRRLIRDVLGKLITQYGCAVTTVMKDNERGQRFVERLGFNKVREEKGTIGYELRQLRF